MAVLLFTAGVRWRLLEVAFERDEGEFAYIAQQMLDGVPPYKSGYAMKMPGIYAAYALSMIVFGETIRGVHLGAGLVNLASIVLVFLIARRLYDEILAVVAAAMFALLTLDPTLETVAQAEHFVILPSLLGVWLLLAAYANGARGRALAEPQQWDWPILLKLFAAGFCFGLSAIIKQHGSTFLLLAAWYTAYQWWSSSSRRAGSLLGQLTVLAIGSVVPFLIVCAALYWVGVFDQFWFWTITYSRLYVGYTPLSEGLRRLVVNGTQLVKSSPLVWGAAAIGLTSLFWDPKNRSQRGTMLAWLGFSFLAVCPGMYFRAHYFVYIVPVAAILAATGCTALVRLGRQETAASRAARMPWSAIAVATVIVAGSIAYQSFYFFRATPVEASRIAYKRNPFPEAIEIARYISTHSTEKGPIMVFGSEPQIYFYLNRQAASPHIYMYPLMEVHPFSRKMQEEMAAQVTEARPEWIISELYNAAWSWQEGSEGWIFNWIGELLERDYVAVGMVDLLSVKRTEYTWGEHARSHQPRSNVSLSIFRRKDAAPLPMSPTTLIP